MIIRNIIKMSALSIVLLVTILITAGGGSTHPANAPSFSPALIQEASAAELKHKAALPDGRQIFLYHCAMCHRGGRNLLNPSKPIIGSAKLKSEESFKRWLSNPISPMPPFKSIVSHPAQLRALYHYCKSLK